MKKCGKYKETEKKRRVRCRKREGEGKCHASLHAIFYFPSRNGLRFFSFELVKNDAVLRLQA